MEDTPSAVMPGKVEAKVVVVDNKIKLKSPSHGTAPESVYSFVLDLGRPWLGLAFSEFP